MDMDVKQIQQLISANTDHFQGVVDERFIDLAQLFSKLQDARSTLGGAALAVYFQGRGGQINLVKSTSFGFSRFSSIRL